MVPILPIGALAAAGPLGRNRLMSQGDPQIIAHRGFAGVAPENTLPAFKAIGRGTHQADMVELDVVPAAEGTPVVFHDAHLDATGESRGITDGSGAVWETSLSQLEQLSVVDSGAGIPTLEAVLDRLPEAVGVNIELKNPGTVDLRPGSLLDPEEIADRRERWDPFVERVLAAISAHAHPVVVSSFHEAALASVRDLGPDLPIGVLFHRLPEGLTLADRYEAHALHPPIELVPGTPYFDPCQGEGSSQTEDLDLLAAAADRGLALNVWTVTSWHQAAWMARAGVDGLIADYPGLLSGPSVSP